MSKKKAESISFSSLASKISKLLKENSDNTLQAVHFNPEMTNEYAYYYSPSELSLVHIPLRAELYILPVKHTDSEKVYLYSPYILREGVIVSVNKELIIIIGDN
jgi:hypothetical protein|tara:strand:- start:445 stop:756 length:312 start_codon:yes stop_codon:yes gene_type:complete